LHYSLLFHIICGAQHTVLHLRRPVEHIERAVIAGDGDDAVIEGSRRKQ